MGLLAREMNLSETAFMHPVEGGYSLRWLTPKVEVQLCGHATLAAAHVLWHTGVIESSHKARFQTLSGWLECVREGEWIAMDFPARTAVACDTPTRLAEALGCEVEATCCNGMDYLVEVRDAGVVRGLTPNFAALSLLPVRGVIVTSRSDASEWDFVSRFFAPAAGVDEDPVTGSAHCALGPYWGEKLGKTRLVGYQASLRGGVVDVALAGERVVLRGRAVLMSRVELAHWG
jgi:PhzF family phenazine biosynthesis protein